MQVSVRGKKAPLALSQHRVEEDAAPVAASSEAVSSKVSDMAPAAGSTKQ